MTCAEFRRLNYSDAALLDMTRRERDLCRAHYRGCQACQEWIDQQEGDDPGLTEGEAVRQALALLFRDLVEAEGDSTSR